MLSAVGGSNNAYTSNDATVYFEEVPSNALELPLFLESDRLAYFVDELAPDIVDGQRDVVKNERRQSYENRPYGAAWLAISDAIYPAGHPYHHPVIGSHVLDEVLGLAAWAAGYAIVVGRLNIHFQKLLPLRTVVEVRSRVVSVEGRKVMVHGGIHGPEGVIYAEADCLCITIPGL